MGEKRLIIANEQFKLGNQAGVVVYDDAVGDEDESEKPRPKLNAGAEEANGKNNGDSKKTSEDEPPLQGPSLPDDLNELVRHKAAVTAGSNQKEKKRGGVKET